MVRRYKLQITPPNLSEYFLNFLLRYFKTIKSQAQRNTPIPQLPLPQHIFQSIHKPSRNLFLLHNELRLPLLHTPCRGRTKDSTNPRANQSFQCSIHVSRRVCYMHVVHDSGSAGIDTLQSATQFAELDIIGVLKRAGQVSARNVVGENIITVPALELCLP
jgi:hypothetical protein